MHAIILHNNPKRITTLQKELRHENIMTERKIWGPRAAMDFSNMEMDVVLIHCTSPKAEILSLIPELRLRKYAIPIIVLDEINSTETQKNAYKSGADLYITKPFMSREIAIQLKNLLSKKEALGANKWLRAFDVWLDMEHRSVKRKQHIIPLRNKEFALLEFFIMNRGKLLSRNAILEHVWDRNARFNSNTVDVHINRLRRKLDDPFHNKLIHTVHSIGYIFDKKRA